MIFYKKWYNKFFDLKKGKGKVVFYRSVHRLVGVWSIPFALLIAVTGIWYFLERTNIADISKVANTRPSKLSMPISDSTVLENIGITFDYDRAVEQAMKEIPNLKVKDISPPSRMDGPVYLTGISNVPLVRNRANRVYIHPETYEVVGVQRAEEIPARTWLNDIADPLHFGYWGGLMTKVIWFLGGLAISGLVLTGMWISQKRKIKDEKKRKAKKMGIWKYVNWTIYGIVLAFMYYFLIVRYDAPIGALILVTVGWVCFVLCWWYLFDYKIYKVVEKELMAV